MLFGWWEKVSVLKENPHKENSETDAQKAWGKISHYNVNLQQQLQKQLEGEKKKYISSIGKKVYNNKWCIITYQFIMNLLYII